MKFIRSVSTTLVLLAFVCTQPLTPRAQQAAPTANTQSKAPAIVFLIRHAEKPMDEKDPDLTPQGYKRAQALPSLFLQTPGSSTLPRLPRPNFLFATDMSKHSNRPLETITPLAAALHLKIDHNFADREFAAVADEVLSGKYAGKVVLICWHHGEIPHLAHALGAADTPKKWDDTVFDQIWMLEWVDGKVVFSALPEYLLPGDAAQ